MRRLASTCLIERTVPKVVINRQNFPSQTFGTLPHEDLPTGSSRETLTFIQTFETLPCENRPEGLVQTTGFIHTNLRDGETC